MTRNVERGVWVAPWMGPGGETILVAVRRNGRLLGEPVVVSSSDSHVAAVDELWALLDEFDPEPALQLVR